MDDVLQTLRLCAVFAGGTLVLAVATAVEAADKPAEPAKISIQAVDKAGYEKVLKSQKGQVVLVDFWATWCVPCLKAFPHTVELHRKYGPAGLTVVSVSMDDPDAEADALKFLEQQKAQFTNLRSRQGAEAEAVEAFDIDGGAIPHFKLYDRTGKLHKKFVSGDDAKPFGPQDIEAAVRELLTAPKP
jgi:thiol-disulfide isomerase/thioredoxin